MSEHDQLCHAYWRTGFAHGVSCEEEEMRQPPGLTRVEGE